MPKYPPASDAMRVKAFVSSNAPGTGSMGSPIMTMPIFKGCFAAARSSCTARPWQSRMQRYALRAAASSPFFPARSRKSPRKHCGSFRVNQYRTLSDSASDMVRAKKAKSSGVSSQSQPPFSNDHWGRSLWKSVIIGSICASVRASTRSR